MRPRGIGFADAWDVVAVKGDEESAIIPYGWINQGRKAVRINSVAVWFVVSSISWVIDQDRIGAR